MKTINYELKIIIFILKSASASGDCPSDPPVGALPLDPIGAKPPNPHYKLVIARH